MRHCYVLRVFTREDQGGNHLAVVTDVTGLHEKVMQEIAFDNGFSETIFIDWREGGVPTVRIFTPEVELPFAGHPLVGAAWVLGMAGPGTVDRMRCDVGEIPFRVDGDMVWVDTPMVNQVRPADDALRALASAGLPEPDGTWWAEMPLPYLVAEYGDPDDVLRAAPDLDALQAGGVGMCYLVAPMGDSYKARFFAHGAGIPEDPATGSAAAALAAVMRHRGRLTGEHLVNQGDEIGHPSTIHLRWDEQHASLGGTVRRDEVRVIEK